MRSMERDPFSEYLIHNEPNKKKKVIHGIRPLDYKMLMD